MSDTAINWVDLDPPETVTTKYTHGPRITASISSNGEKVRVTLNKLAIDEFFGEALAGRTFNIRRSLDANGWCWLHILECPDGRFSARNQLKGAAYFPIKSDSFGSYLPKEGVAAQPCDNIDLDEATGALSLRLPASFQFVEKSS